MDLHDSVAVVTGSNRGLGREFAAQLLERGAKKVYATARNPERVQIAGVTPLGLDITDPDSVARAAAGAGDATVLINNAGITTGTSLIDGDLAQIELEMQTNFYGPLRVTRAFAPILASNGGGAILNVLSVISWLHLPRAGAYGASKAAAWAMTDAARQELAPPRHPRRRACTLPTWTRTWWPTSMFPRPTRLTSRRWRWTASRPTSPRSSPTTSPATSSRASRPRPPSPSPEAIVAE